MLASWLRSLLCESRATRQRKLKARRRSTFFRPQIENLEGRAMFAFLTPVTVPVGSSPAGIAVGDFNADGRQDMAVVDSSAGNLGVMLSNGDGTFQATRTFASGAGSYDAVFADYNGDGKGDVAVVSTNGNVNVLLGDGTGNLSGSVSYGVGVGSHSINKGDFNGDGKLDIATMNSGTASLLLGNGDGTFQAATNTLIPGNSTNTVVGDFNRDGNLDLATSNTMSSGTITILKGHGDGSFDAAQSVYAYSAPVYLGVGDFNNDGYDDFAVPNSYALTSMTVVMNNGDGTYSAPQTYAIPQTGYEIEVEDFDGDGNDDFAVRGATQYMIHYGKGDGTFLPEVTLSTPVGRFENGAHGDFNGDGAVDFAYASTSGVTVVMNANDTVTNLAGATGFTINALPTTSSGDSVPLTITIRDADGNIASGFVGTVYVSTDDPVAPSFAYRFTPADAGIHTFTTSLKLFTTGQHTVTVSAPLMAPASTVINVTPAVTQLQVQGIDATIAGQQFTVSVTALDSTGAIASGYQKTVHFTSTDGLADLPADYTFTAEDAGVHTFTVTLKSAGSKWINVSEIGKSLSGGKLVTVSPVATSGFLMGGASGAIGVARTVTLAAADTYGNVDASYNGTVHFTSSDPTAVLPTDATFVNGRATVSVTFFTVGRQSFTATDNNNPGITATIYSDALPPVPAAIAITGTTSTTAGSGATFVVSVRDTIGQIATGYRGTVYLNSSDGQAGLPASYTFTEADAGVHTFTVVLKTAGVQSVTAVDTTGTMSATQMGIAVNAAAFSSFRLTVSNPSDSDGEIPLTAGDIVGLKVQAVDAYGNAVNNYRGKVKFSSSDAQAALPTDYSFSTADAGTHTFNVVLKTATSNGLFSSISVVDASNATTLATVGTFTVTNAAAASFSLNVPSNVTAGAPFTLRVSVLDAYGNKVKNYFGTVHFANTAGVAGLPADYTFNALDAGVHDFTVTLSTVGNQTLTISDLLNPNLKKTVTVSVRTASTGGGGGGGGSGGGKSK
jgi:hypothetical protein